MLRLSPNLIAVQVIAEARGNRTGDRRDCMRRQRRAGGRIAIVADVGLPRQVADGIVGEGLRRRNELRRQGTGGHGRREEAVQGVVGEALGEVLVFSLASARVSTLPSAS
jgi:hypothetical protein